MIFLFENSIFKDLVKRYHENKLSHAFLLETNDFNKCYSDLLKFVKTINCEKEYKDDCDDKSCNLCELIDNNSLPSFIKIEPDGTQIKKIQIQEIIDRFQSMPIFSKYNIYVVNECEKMNTSSANSLLKFLEEPEDNILGFFITSNKMNVISTIRSRCQEYSLYYDIDVDNMLYGDLISNYLNNIYRNNEGILYNKVEAINYFKERSEWLEFFKEMILVFSLYIKGKHNNYNINLFNDLPLEKIIIVVDLIETILKYIQSNGNIELILDKFVLEMRNICE